MDELQNLKLAYILLTFALAVFGWFLRRIILELDANTARNQATSKELDGFRLHVAETYTKESEMKQMVAELRTEVNSWRKEMLELMTTMQNDIKTLLSKRR